MPPFKNHNSTAGIPNLPYPSGRNRLAEIVPIFEEPNQSLVGQTLDSTGSPLANCIVYLFRADFIPAIAQPVDSVSGLPSKIPTPTYVSVLTSDGSGNFTFNNLSRNSGPYFIVAYKSDGTAVGTTYKTLTV